MSTRTANSTRGMMTRIALLALLWCCVAPEGALAADPGGTTEVFRAIEDAWRAGSAEGLAHRVQIDGIRVNVGGSAGRVTEYSPSQSIYFFRQLFQHRVTNEFEFTRMQDVRDGERAHGMALWRFSNTNAGEDREMRLVFLLTRQDDVWRISEVQQISVR